MKSKAEIGALGGRATVQKYGLGHMAKLARKGAEALHSKYKLVPCGTNDFMFVNRETGERLPKTLNGNTLPLQG